MSMSSSSRKSKGRQKVRLVKMEKQSNLQVTFSKRRAGLFKKASELCTLCAVDAAIVVFSPADKTYCFAHPTLNAVLNRLSDAPVPPEPIIEAHRNSAIRQLNLELTQVEGMLRAEKRRAQKIEAVAKSGPSLDELSYAQLCVVKKWIMAFKKNLDARVQAHMVRSPFQHHPTDPAGADPRVSSWSNGVDNTGLFAPNDPPNDYNMFNFIGGD